MLKEAHELSKVPNERELDVLLSSGEQVSISKLSILLNELGYKAISLTGWQAGIYTNSTNQNAIIQHIDNTRICEELERRKIVIIAGFQGINSNSDITTLGRGGSDTTAVAISASLKAKHCYIFSDVDGVYTTDPNRHSEAKKLESLSYVEMLDISDEGAKVLHNRCIEIGKKFNIPIITKSTFNDKPGSIIDDVLEEKCVKSIIKNDDIIFVRLENTHVLTSMVNTVYNKLIANNIMPIQFINNSNSHINIELLIKSSYFNKLQKIFETEFSDYSYSTHTITRIAIVGYGITTDSAILDRVLNIVQCFEIDVHSIDITNTKIIITFRDSINDDLLKLLHTELFPD